ncbi:T9SS type A sorting domain-containing protein [bacterium]|nr:T9SS type A sorting domain-containing protein [bacterium]
MKNYYLILSILLLQCFLVQDVSAGYCVTTGDGDWDDASTWSCGRVPGSGDTIVIRAQDSIYVESSYTGLTGVWLQVYGKLDFKNAARIVFEYGDTSIAPSMITFYTGAVCQDGNGSSGLSFGSGGSGCDVYRPGQGANPGVYPTIPGSYYDGCVWAAYLPVSGLFANVELVEDQMKFEWSIYENNSVDHYEVFGYNGNKKFQLESINSQNLEYGQSHYIASYPVAGLDKIEVIAFQHNETTLPIAVGSVEHLVPLIQGDVTSKPNPFDKYIEVNSRFTVDVKVYSMDGKLMYEGSNQTKYHINSEGYDGGMYFIELTKNNVIISRRKILKL